MKTESADAEQMKAKRKESETALKALREAEDKVSTLESRRAELGRKLDATDTDIAEGRLTLDKATEQAAVSGDESDLQRARDMLATAKRKRDDIAEQIEALDRVIERSKGEIEPALNAAKSAHRAYWMAVEAEAREKAKEAAQLLLRAYAAYRAHRGIRDSSDLKTFLNGGGYSDGLLKEIGVVQDAAHDMSFGDGVEQAEPRSRYVNVY